MFAGIGAASSSGVVESQTIAGSASWSNGVWSAVFCELASCESISKITFASRLQGQSNAAGDVWQLGTFSVFSGEVRI